MVRVTGPVVLELQAVFVQDWYLETGEPIADRRAVSRSRSHRQRRRRRCCRRARSIRATTTQRLIVALVNGARARAVITTPYFIPDEHCCRR